MSTTSSLEPSDCLTFFTCRTYVSTHALGSTAEVVNVRSYTHGYTSQKWTSSPSRHLAVVDPVLDVAAAAALGAPQRRLLRLDVHVIEPPAGFGLEQGGTWRRGIRRRELVQHVGHREPVGEIVILRRREVRGALAKRRPESRVRLRSGSAPVSL